MLKWYEVQDVKTQVFHADRMLSAGEKIQLTAEQATIHGSAVKECSAPENISNQADEETSPVLPSEIPVGKAKGAK